MYDSSLCVIFMHLWLWLSIDFFCYFYLEKNIKIYIMYTHLAKNIEIWFLFHIAQP